MYVGRELEPEIRVYVDSEWGGDVRTRRSTSGGLMLWQGSWMLSWSRLQSVTALPSGEAEYYALTLGLQEAMAMQSLLRELQIDVRIKLLSDSAAAKQGAEKVGLFHVKHLSLRLCRAGGDCANPRERTRRTSGRSPSMRRRCLEV